MYLILLLVLGGGFYAGWWSGRHLLQKAQDELNKLVKKV